MALKEGCVGMWNVIILKACITRLPSDCREASYGKAVAIRAMKTHVGVEE